MTKTVRLTQGYVAFVDDEDYDRVAQFKWCALLIRRRDGSIRNIYGKRTRKAILLHRFILGVTDPMVEVDHRDHDGLNCVRSNMRLVTHAQNAHNCRSHKDSKSRFLGVTWDKERGKWLAQIRRDGRNRFLGRFSTEAEAHAAYEAAR